MEKETCGGLVHLYCGDGKGKTTAGMGLCLRAAGVGQKVLIFQFLKDNRSSERAALAAVPGVTLVPGPDRVKFTRLMTPEEKEERRRFYDGMLKALMRRTEQEGFRLLFLDEAVGAAGAGLLDEELLLSLIRSRPADLEVVLTGRDPSPALMAAADYVTEMKKRRHPYDRGIGARDGIER